MSEEGDFLREFEDDQSVDQPGGASGAFNRQASKLSEAVSRQASTGFYRADSGVGAVGTPQSAQVDLLKAESQMSATTNNDGGRRGHNQGEPQKGHTPEEFAAMPVNLADLQDDDKSSLESGQVSPAAFEEGAIAPPPQQQPPAVHHQQHQNNRFNGQGAGPQGGRNKMGNMADNKRMNKRRDRYSRSRSQSPGAFNNPEGNFGGGGFGGGQNHQGQHPNFYQGGEGGRGHYNHGHGRGHHNNHNSHFQGGNNHYGGNHRGGDDHGRGGFRGGHHNNFQGQFGGHQRRQNPNNGGGQNYNGMQHQNSFGSQQSQQSQGNFGSQQSSNSLQGQQQQQQRLLQDQLRIQRQSTQQKLQMATQSVTKLQQQVQQMPMDHSLKEKLQNQLQILQRAQMEDSLVNQQQYQLMQQQQQQSTGGGNGRGGNYFGNNQGQMQNSHHGGQQHQGHRGGFNKPNNYGGGGRGGRGFNNHRGGGGMGGNNYMGRGDGGQNVHGYQNQRGGHNNHRGGGGGGHHMGGNQNSQFGNMGGQGHGMGMGQNNANNGGMNQSMLPRMGLHDEMGGQGQNPNQMLTLQRQNISAGSQLQQPGPMQRGQTAKPQQTNMINARRFSVYIKNVPQDKFNNRDIDSFFSQFGEVVRIDRHFDKMAATIKFKDIESAQNAADFAIQQRQPIWGIPTIQLIYNITGQTTRGNQPPALQKQFSMPAPVSTIKPLLTEEQRLHQQKLEAGKKLIEQKRLQLYEKCDKQVKKLIKQLNEPDVTPEKKEQIEQQISAQKAKMREIKEAEEKDKKERVLQARQQVKLQKQQIVAPKAATYLVEMKLVDIESSMRQTSSILECLKVFATVRDFKFLDEEKSTAYVKFLSQYSSADQLKQRIEQSHVQSGSQTPFEMQLVSQ